MTNLLLLGFLPSGSEWIIIALVILLLFGGKKIPELMRGLGKGVKSFKDGVNEAKDDSLIAFPTINIRHIDHADVHTDIPRSVFSHFVGRDRKSTRREYQRAGRRVVEGSFHSYSIY